MFSAAAAQTAHAMYQMSVQDNATVFAWTDSSDHSSGQDITVNALVLRPSGPLSSVDVNAPTWATSRWPLCL